MSRVAPAKLGAPHPARPHPTLLQPALLHRALLRRAVQHRALWVALLLVAFACRVAAQPATTTLSHEVWDRGDGLVQSTVTALATASPGYLFAGTQAGLSRFDGVRFVNFPAQGSRDERHFITSLAADEDLVWVGTRRGLLRYRGGDLEKPAALGALTTTYVRSLLPLGNGLLVGLSRSGLRVVADQQVLTVEDAAEGTFRALALEPGGRLLAGSDDGLYLIRSGASWRAEVLLPDVSVRAIAASDGATCVGTDAGALLCEEQGGFREVHRLDAPITALLSDPEGRLWIATNGDGVWIHEDGELLPTSGALPIKFSFALLRDESGNTWVGSRHGLVRLKIAKVLSFGEPEGLPGDFARAVLQQNDKLWVGTGAGVGVAEWPMVEEFRTVTLDPRTSSTQVRALHAASDGTLRIGTRAGVQVLTSLGFRSESSLEMLASSTINAFAESNDGSLWVATSGGVWQQSQQGTLRLHLENTTIRSLLSDGDDVWIGSERGLWRSTSGQLQRHPALDDRSIVLSLERSKEQDLWVGTAARGIYRIDRDGQLAPRSAQLGGPVFSIHEIGDHLWTSTPAGLSRISTSELTDYVTQRRETFATVNWDESSGMRSSETNGGSQPAAWVDDNNMLWVATIAGVVAVDTEKAIEETRVASIWLEDIRYDGVSTDFNTDEVLELPAGRRNLDIVYAGAQYSLPSPISFRYRLSGFDEEWKDVGRLTTATFTNLPPGRFRFEVQASTGGTWQPTGAALELDLAAHLAEKPSSWFVPGFLVLSAVIGWWRLRERNSKRQREALERLVEERTNALAIANRELTGLARTDALTQLANRRWFDRRLKEEWARAARGTPLSVLVFDIDDFKSINDRYGHLAGDECLRLVARTIALEFRRAGDFVARYGGEEFVAILPNGDGESAQERAEAVRKSVANMLTRHEDASFAVTISCGIGTSFPTVDSSPESVLDAADRALYRAKQAGKNRVVLG